MPVVVFASPTAISNYGDKAQRLGAFACTSGVVSLFENVLQVLASRNVGALSKPEDKFNP